MAAAMIASGQISAATCAARTANIARSSIFANGIPSLAISGAKVRTVKSGKIRAGAREESQTKRVAQIALVLTTASVSAAGPASAVDTETVSNVLSQVEDAVQQATSAAVSAYDYASDVAAKVADFLAPAIDAATPVVKQATQAALDAAAPIASDVASQAQRALSDYGVDTAPVVEAAKTAASVAGEVSEQTGKAIEAATPVASSTVESILAQEPAVIAAGLGALALLYILTPTFFSSLAYAARGYAGELTAAQTLDLLTQADYNLVDVRTEKERGKSGIPSLPKFASNKLISVPVEEVSSKLRGQLRSPKRVEAELTAIKIAALKRYGKNSKIVILDSNSDIGKLVAKSLAALGFKNTWVVKDGMDGRSGWVQSQLGTEEYNYGSTILSPSRIIPAATKVFRSRSKAEVVDVPKRGFLLSGGSE